MALNPAIAAAVPAQKRQWLFLGAVALALAPLAGIGLQLLTGREGFALLPMALIYLGVPLLDWIVGEDTSNPAEEADQQERWLPAAAVPAHFLTLIIAAWWAATQIESTWVFIGFAAFTGVVSGTAVNTAHELGHKTSRWERRLAQWALAVPAYGHFCVEHNLGHHRHVATPEDVASARMGETIYAFALREIPGALRRGWRLEKDRLARSAMPAWSVHNRILQSFAVTLLLQGGLVVALGPAMLLFLLIHNAEAWWQLTSANYVEHYGLLRRRLDNGRYEPCQPHHSWNSSHLVSNLLLFNLQRHSDHHANPGRPWQRLRHEHPLPSLPSGYFGMYLLAYLPPLWFRVMDRRLLSLPHVAGDLSRVNRMAPA